MQQHPRPRATLLLGLASALRDHIDISPVNQGLNKPGHWSSSLYDIGVHIFDCFQLRLWPDHIVIPTICTKHRDHPQDHPDLLNALSPRTYWQPSLQHSTASTFSTAETTQTLHNSHSTLSSMISSINTWYLVVSTCPCHLSSPQSMTLYR